MGKGPSKKSAISSTGKPVAPEEKKQIEVFGDPQGRRASGRQEIHTDIETVRYHPQTGEPITDSEGNVERDKIGTNYGLQVEDKGSEYPLNNTFGPDFQPIVAPDAPPSRSGHFVLGQDAARGHAVAFAMSRNQRYLDRIAGELMLPDAINPVRSKVKLVDMGGSTEEERRPRATAISGPKAMSREVPNPRNKRNNSSGTDRFIP